MMRDFGILNSRRNETGLVEKCIDSQLWHACAGSIVQIPPVNTKVVYFPQGHAEHVQENVDFGSHCRIPSVILCNVASVKYMAEPETDEVFAKIKLMPLNNANLAMCDEGNRIVPQDKSVSFAKTLTQSDANNGGGFSVPRFCAETIFPPLDFTVEPPVQIIFAKDVHGEVWKFRHIYRGTPRRHLLTTGWSNFVNKKKLVAGDSIVFMRTESGDLLVGIKRAKRGIGCAYECPSSRWNGYGPCSGFAGEDNAKLMKSNCSGDMREKLSAASVFEAATLAVSGQPFEVIYYPRLNSPEFFVSASAVRSAMMKQWCPGMRFKMAFETEDSSRISWFMGSISSVQEADPIRWPKSPWRLLQVEWDEPNLLQNVKRVSPWLIELVEDMPTIDRYMPSIEHLLPFSPLRKKLRLLQPQDFSLSSQFPVPSFTSNPLSSNSPVCSLMDHVPAGIQGARHAQFQLPSPDILLDKPQAGLFSDGVVHLDHAAAPTIPNNKFIGDSEDNESVSCLLTIGNSPQHVKTNAETRTPRILLFGQLIYTSSDDTSRNSSPGGNAEKASIYLSDDIGSASHKTGMHESSSDEGSPCYKGDRTTDHVLETGHCNVLINSEDAGWTIDLSVLGSYKELYEKLANKFGTKISEMLGKVLYLDAEGTVKHTGDESYSEFLKTARKLNILVERDCVGFGC